MHLDLKQAMLRQSAVCRDNTGRVQYAHGKMIGNYPVLLAKTSRLGSNHSDYQEGKINEIIEKGFLDCNPRHQWIYKVPESNLEFG